MRHLLVGGAGFVGSHLADLLVRAGHQVDVLDNYSTGMPENLKRRPALRVIRGDLTRVRLPSRRYDTILHLASPASPRDYHRLGVETLMVNAIGTKRLLDLAVALDADLLLASTSEIYGDPLEHPQRESYWGNVDPVGPRCAYDEGKRFAEALTMTYVRKRGARARIVRIFNAYGPRMRAADGRMPSEFILAALAGRPLQVEGDGSQTRSLCYVGDTANGLWRVLRKGRIGGVYNIGRSEEISVIRFARLVRRLCDSSSPIVHVPGRQQEIRRRCPDTSLTKREIGWSAPTDLRTGLRRTIRWYRMHV